MFARSSFLGAATVGRPSFAGEASFDGSIAFTTWPRSDVARLLPAELALAENTSPTPDLHPVVFVFGAHTRTSLVFARATVPIGAGYGEFALVVPFVTHPPTLQLHCWIARMYSSYFPAVWDGNVRYGFSKALATMVWHGPMFVMTNEQGALLLHAAIETESEWSGRGHGDLPHFAALQEMFSLPIVGRKADGGYVCSWFDWEFAHAAVRPIASWISVDAPLIPGLAEQCHAAPVGFDVRRMIWKLSWPSACRF